MRFKLFLAYLSEFIRDGFYLSVFLLLPFIVKDIHLNLFQAGTFQTIVNVLIMLLALPIVSLLIKFGEIKLLFASFALYALGFLSFFFANSYVLLAAAFSIMGIAFACFTPTSSHIRSTWFAKETRGKELGNLMAFGDIGKVLFSLAVGALAGALGWRLMSLWFGVATGLLFLLLCLIAFRTNKKANAHIQPDQTTSEHFSYFYFLRQKKIVLAMLATSFDEGVNTPFYAFLPFLLLSKGVSLPLIGEFTAFYYVGNIISRLVFGRLIDKAGHAKTFIALELSMALFTFLLASLHSLLLISILALILGTITEGTDPATASMLAEALESIKNPQKVAGIRAIANGLTRAIFPLLIGSVATMFGIVTGFYALALLSLLPIIPAALFLREIHNS